ncbi:hypothetical protein EV421DRAFT_1970135 [Armillaria borealis]|uniref:Uncharacterized protein n=1 Tax=Armillaria borealis TaxID=47425 RepID=A0AA39J9S5_9AGAR|nr:hypothetical protein EV421DRAFT_1970135 [Armillaria borealis]
MHTHRGIADKKKIAKEIDSGHKTNTSVDEEAYSDVRRTEDMLDDEQREIWEASEEAEDEKRKIIYLVYSSVSDIARKNSAREENINCILWWWASWVCLSNMRTTSGSGRNDCIGKVAHGHFKVRDSECIERRGEGRTGRFLFGSTVLVLLPAQGPNKEQPGPQRRMSETATSSFVPTTTSIFPLHITSLSLSSPNQSSQNISLLDHPSRRRQAKQRDLRSIFIFGDGAMKKARRTSLEGRKARPIFCGTPPLPRLLRVSQASSAIQVASIPMLWALDHLLGASREMFIGFEDVHATSHPCSYFFVREGSVTATHGMKKLACRKPPCRSLEAQFIVDYALNLFHVQLTTSTYAGWYNLI